MKKVAVRGAIVMSLVLTLAADPYTADNSTTNQLKCHIADRTSNRADEVIYCPRASADMLTLALATRAKSVIWTTS
jgi:hypothetical protein